MTLTLGDEGFEVMSAVGVVSSPTKSMADFIHVRRLSHIELRFDGDANGLKIIVYYQNHKVPSLIPIED